jgi:hypothetical protein
VNGGSDGRRFTVNMYTMVLLVLLALLTGCSKLTADNYARITTGVEYREVVRILGTPVSCSEVVFVKSCIWGNEQKNITVSFMGDTTILTGSKNIK